MKYFYILTFSLFIFFNLNSQTINNTGSLNEARMRHESQLLNNGNVIVFGGDNGGVNSTPKNTAEIYNVTTGTWSFVSSMNIFRNKFASVLLKDGRVLAIGGGYSNTCEVYDPVLNTWTLVANMNIGREDHEAIVLDNGSVLVVGGSGDERCEVYDVNTNTWYFVGSTNESRYDLSLTRISSGEILAISGYTQELFNQQSLTWGSNYSSADYREDHGAAILDNGYTIIAGGVSNSLSSKKISYNGTWKYPNIPALNQNHIACDIVSLHDNRALIYGLGDFFSPGNTQVYEIYDYTTDTWTSPITSFTGAQYYTIDKLYNGKILIAGGSAGGTLATSCKLFTDSELATCNINQGLIFSSSSNSVCLGVGVDITIPNAESGVEYTAIISNKEVSINALGGGSITLNIPENQLNVGNNIIRIKAKKTGCISKTLNHSESVNVTIQNNTLVTVNHNGSAVNCAGDIVTLNSNVPVLWSNGISGSSINVTNEATIFAQEVNVNGCKTAPTVPIYFDFLAGATNVNAFPGSIYRCHNSLDTVPLIGSPPGGIWLGPGIVNDTFYMAQIPSDTAFKIYYDYCGSMDSIFVEKRGLQEITYDCNLEIDSLFCPSIIPINLPEVSISNLSSGNEIIIYQDGDTLAQPGYLSTSGNYSININIDSTNISEIVIELYSSFYCQIQRDTFYAYMAQVADSIEMLPLDSLCIGEALEVTIVNSDINSNYYLYSSFNQQMSDTLRGNGNNLQLLANGPGGNFSIRVTDTLNYCYFTPSISNLNFYYSTVNAAMKYDFFASNYLAAGDSLQFQIDKSTFGHKSDSTSWELNGQYISSEDSVNITFSQLGINTITLFAHSNFNCIDSVKREINVYPIQDSAPSYSGNVCSFKPMTFHQYEEGITAIDIDKDNNRIVGSYRKTNSGFELLFTLTKYNDQDSLLWTHSSSINSGGCRGSYINAIEIDQQGNIYFGGNAGGSVNVLGTWASDMGAVNRLSFIAKSDPQGNLLWLKHYHGGSTSSLGSTLGTISDIYIENDSSIFLLAKNSVESIFFDTDFKVGNGAITVININEMGDIQKKWNSPSQEYLCCGYDPYSSATGALCTGRYFAYGPKFLVDNCGNFHIKGRSKTNTSLAVNSNQMLNFNNHSSFDIKLNISDSIFTDGIVLPENHYTSATYFSSSYTENNAEYDIYGNLYTAGTTIDSTSSLADDEYKINIYSKYDSNGNLIWRREGTTVQIVDLAVVDNQMILYGNFKTAFGIKNTSGNLIGKSAFDDVSLFLASISLNGDINWIETMANQGLGANYGLAKKMTYDKCSNKLFLIANFNHQANIFGTTFLTPNSNSSNAMIELSLGNNCSNSNSCGNYENSLAIVQNLPDSMNICYTDTVNLSPTFSNTSFNNYEIKIDNGNFAPLSSISGNYLFNGSDLELWGVNGTEVTLRLNYNGLCGQTGFKDVFISGFAPKGFVRSSDFIPLKDSKIYVIEYNPVDSSLHKIDSTMTDSLGEFSLNNLNEGLYIKAIPNFTLFPNQIPTYFTNSVLFQTADSITCSSVLDFFTISGINTNGPGFIGGFIGNGVGKNNELGIPLSGLDLLLINDNGDVVSYTNTDVNGYFSFDNLPCDEYSIWIDDGTTNNTLFEVLSIEENCIQDDLIFNLNNEVLKLIENEEDTATSLTSLFDYNIQFKPNPFNEYIEVIIDDNQSIGRILITNILGEFVLEKNISNKELINTKNWTKGIYFANIYLNNGQYFKTKKLLKD
ncbi:MAG: T9SS type A sorting domain-containing protein [Chitinophagales bacterium]